MNQPEHQKRAIPFIVLGKNRQFEVTKEAEAFLATLENRKLGVVSIAGKYRTGKSYLLNKIIQRRKERPGFEVGPTINSCTKGIWLWPETFKSENPDEPGLEVIVLDTEGFGGINENQNHDNRIFIFSLLLSSMFVYNSIGSIDENALQTLSLIVNLAKNIQLGESKAPGESSNVASESLVSEVSHDASQLAKASNLSGIAEQGEEAIVENFPFFLWVIRDFCLELKDSHGNTISSKSYFENALKGVAQSGSASEGKNRVRALIKHFFRNRDCLTMVRPVEKESELQSLDAMGDDQLRPEFVLQINRTRKMVLMRTGPKRIKGSHVDGVKLCQLASAYVKSINSGAAPNIDNAWNYILQFENEKKLRQLFHEMRGSGQAVRSQAEVEAFVERFRAAFEGLRVGTVEETAEVRAKIEGEVRAELETECSRFNEAIKARVGERVADGLDVIRQQIIGSDSVEPGMVEQMIEQRTVVIVGEFSGCLSEKQVRQVTEEGFGKGKADLLTLMMMQFEKAKARELREQEGRKLAIERKCQDRLEQMEEQVESLNEQAEADKIRMGELVRESQRLEVALHQTREDREKLSAKLRNKEVELAALEGELNDTRVDEVGALQKQVQELGGQLQEREVAMLRETSLLAGKVVYLEECLQQSKREVQMRENELAESRTRLMDSESQIGALKDKLQNAKAAVPDTHMLIEKAKFSEMKEKYLTFDDLKDNYEKIIREVMEERNMVQGQFEFLRENFELEKTKNYKLLKEIYEKVTSTKDDDRGVLGSQLRDAFGGLSRTTEAQRP